MEAKPTDQDSRMHGAESSEVHHVRGLTCVCGRLRRRKGYLTFGAEVGCGHVSGLLLRSMTAGPDAIRSPGSQSVLRSRMSCTLNGFCHASGSTSLPSRRHHPRNLADHDGRQGSYYALMRQLPHEGRER